MHALKEIIYLLRDNNVHPLDYLKSTEKKGVNSKLLLLYDGIIFGKFNSDSEAEKVIYPGTLGGAAYRKLKSDLKDRLIESVNEIDTNQVQFSDHQKAYYFCHRQWVAVKVLTGLNANSTALSLASKLLKMTEKFDLTFLSMDITSFLRVQYGLRLGDDIKFKEANTAFDKYKALYHAESLAEELYVQLAASHANVRTVNTDLEKMAITSYEQLLPYMEVFQSYKLQMYGYLVGLLRHTCVNDFERGREFCEKAIQFFKNLAYEATTPLQIFYYQSLLCSVQMKQYKEGQVAAEECLRLMTEGTFNWFKYEELHLHLSLYSGEYQKADSTLHMILKHPRFEFLPDNVRELWAIYESYIYYFHLMDRVKMTRVEKFNLKQFERKTTIFSKDKGGLNVAIIIIRFLIQLREGQVHKILDEQDALNQYCYRHLKGENTQRSYWFIKMLLLIPNSHFDVKLVESRAAQMKEKLDAVPYHIEGPSNETEIIPFQCLWEMALQSLKLKK